MPVVGGQEDERIVTGRPEQASSHRAPRFGPALHFELIPYPAPPRRNAPLRFVLTCYRASRGITMREHWPTWYAQYMVREQKGEFAPI
jgi:hypothetical protein